MTNQETTTCSCGLAEEHVVAKRTCCDGLIVELWSDGDVTCILGRGLRGIGLPRTAEAKRANLRAARAIINDACIVTRGEFVEMLKRARAAARRNLSTDEIRANAWGSAISA